MDGVMKIKHAMANVYQYESCLSCFCIGETAKMICRITRQKDINEVNIEKIAL